MGDGKLNFIRWKYLVPRLILLLACVASVRYGLDPLLHTIIVSSGESATGAKVELASVETSLWNGQVQLRDLQIANPQSPMSNLLDAEHAELQLDMNALFHKRVVIKNGEISGIEFNTERTESGALEIVIDENSEPSALDPLIAQGAQWAGDWFDAASERLDTDFTDQLQTPQVARALENRWQGQGDALHKRVEELKTRGKQLEAEFREVKSNPLRGVEKLPQLQAQLKFVQLELVSIQEQIKKLPEQVKADRQALTAARKADEAFIKQQLKFGRLDGDNLTQVLLGQPVAAGTQSAIDWIVWARKRLPTNSTKQIAKQRSRGTDVTFGIAQPKFHIERLGLSLTAPVSGEPMQFVGSLTHVSDQPRLIAEPAKLQLMATGVIPATLEVVSDRRGDVPREELFLTCTAIPMAGQTLGKSDKLALQLSPSTANVRVELVLTGDDLSGEIAFTQPNFRVSPLANPNSSQTLVAALSEAFGKIDGVSAEIQLAGTLKRPQIKLSSPVGQQLADGISTAVINLASKKSETMLANVSAQMDEQLAKLESTKTKLQDDLTAKLGENQQLFESLATFSTGDTRLPVPQLGSLGGSLLRK
jgi:uncharacterized protein (TIGR03545 family)